ncbi:MAG: aminotransferase class I/II-fold pyridoxal phosphate-dependent enzyme, partial [Clostridia bacterium]|nr:aminotransferase class I/II-fold pyridoxal phosphate-dependent enzyme [Clostridia bacterium]
MIKHVHGGDVYSREIDLDFSANINPLGMPDSVKAAIINSVLEFEKYPDVRCKKLKSAIAEFENVGVDNIVCGNGAADLIYKIVGALKPKRALVPSPTFSEYEKALETFDCEVLYHCLSEENDFKIDERIISKIKGIDMLFLCNPNNPVGNLTDPAIMKKIINKCIEQNVTFVID